MSGREGSPGAGSPSPGPERPAGDGSTEQIPPRVPWYCHGCGATFNHPPPCPACGGDFCEMNVNLQEVGETGPADGPPENIRNLLQMVTGSAAGLFGAPPSPATAAPQDRPPQERAQSPHYWEYPGTAAATRQAHQPEPGQGRPQPPQGPVQQEPGLESAHSQQPQGLQNTVSSILRQLFGGQAPEGGGSDTTQGPNAPTARTATFNLPLGGGMTMTFATMNNVPIRQARSFGGGEELGEVPRLDDFLDMHFRNMRGEGAEAPPFLPTQQATAQDFFNMMTQMLLPPGANINDYAWGERGLDDIVTQMMNEQQQVNHPPPTSELVLKHLERVKTTPAVLAHETECPVCKDSFVLDDANLLIRLPCQHYFHEDCIVPWLQVNGTCPTCRGKVDADTVRVDDRDNENDAESIPQDDLD